MYSYSSEWHSFPIYSAVISGGFLLFIVYTSLNALYHQSWFNVEHLATWKHNKNHLHNSYILFIYIYIYIMYIILSIFIWIYYLYSYKSLWCILYYLIIGGIHYRNYSFYIHHFPSPCVNYAQLSTCKYHGSGSQVQFYTQTGHLKNKFWINGFMNDFWAISQWVTSLLTYPAQMNVLIKTFIINNFTVWLLAYRLDSVATYRTWALYTVSTHRCVCY